MSIQMEPFASAGHFVTYDPYASESVKVAMFRLECRSCGFEPAETVVAPRVCPKCHGKSWQRFTRPGSILDNAERY
jgi:Zn finger protein HypA/HybF involved in hydrogenase expression